MHERISSSSGRAYDSYALRYNPRMLTVDEIRRALAIYGNRQKALAAVVGVEQSTVSRWINKGVVPDPKQEAKIREILGDEGSALLPIPVVSENGAPPRQAVFGSNDLPVYAAVEGGPGELVISTEPIEFVARPWYLGQVKDGFGVIVTGESMYPAYNPGEMAIVHPKLPALIGKTHIFAQDAEDGQFTATLKKLVGHSSTEWKVEQYNPPKVFTLSKALWPKAVRVVGKYEG